MEHQNLIIEANKSDELKERHRKAYVFNGFPSFSLSSSFVPSILSRSSIRSLDFPGLAPARTQLMEVVILSPLLFIIADNDCHSQFDINAS